MAEVTQKDLETIVAKLEEKYAQRNDLAARLNELNQGIARMEGAALFIQERLGGAAQDAPAASQVPVVND